jgi:hypothetical protein
MQAAPAWPAGRSAMRQHMAAIPVDLEVAGKAFRVTRDSLLCCEAGCSVCLAATCYGVIPYTKFDASLPFAGSKDIQIPWSGSSRASRPATTATAAAA